VKRLAPWRHNGARNIFGKPIALQKQWFEGRKRLVDVADTVLNENPESDGFAECLREWLLALEEFSNISRKVNSTIALQALENLKEAFRD
jgi:hypothetical protein